MEMILQIVVSGLATGGVYGLIALGFVLIYKATSVLNLAMGDFMTMGAFICLTVLDTNFRRLFMWPSFLPCSVPFYWG